MIRFISFVFGTLELAQLQFWEEAAAQMSCDKKNVKICTNRVGSKKKCSHTIIQQALLETDLLPGVSEVPWRNRLEKILR